MAQTMALPTGLDSMPAPAPDLFPLQGDLGKTRSAAMEHLSEKPETLEFDDLPPFPDDVPTAPLLRINLRKLLDRDPAEEEKLWRACCDLGFFYLELSGAGEEDGTKRDSAQDPDGDAGINGDGLLADAATLFTLGDHIFALPEAEKQKYDFMDRGSYFGYKGLGSGVVDGKGTRDRNEFYNVSKDDLFGLSERLPAPALLQEEAHRALLKSYMARSHAIVTFILALLNDKLDLPPRTLQSLHRLTGRSGDQVRWVHAPPQPAMDEHQMALGEHTDFGSVTVLFNRLGGLQILPPPSSDSEPHERQWCYVKPLRGHCVVNLGDALVKFTAGLLRSNIHRVVAPPGAQAASPRLSLVYFARPEDEVVLQVLEGSAVIAEKRSHKVEFAGEELVTAKEWVLRRAMGRRAGAKVDWASSGGTEGER